MLRDAQADLDVRAKPAGVRIRADELTTGLDDAMGIDPAIARKISTTRRERIYQRLIDLAAQMMREYGDGGVGFDDVRLEAQRRRWISAADSLSFGSNVMKMAGGRKVYLRRSKLRSARRRLIGVYALPAFFGAAWLKRETGKA
jgi:hypothetical protein